MTLFQLQRGVFGPNGLFIVDVLSTRPVRASATRTDGIGDDFQKWYCVFLCHTVTFSWSGDFRIRRKGTPEIGVTLVKSA